jgi:hypothetical protein
MFSYTQWLDELIKAAGHKYIKRVPYQSGGRLRYRYIYNVTHTHQGKHVLDPDHMKVGTKLMLDATSGKEVHGHITAVSGDKVTFAYDDGPRKGEVVTMTKTELAAELDKVHGISDKLNTARAKQKAVVDKLKERGASEKQIAREQKRLDALGGEAEKDEPKKDEQKSDGEDTAFRLTASADDVGDIDQMASLLGGAFRNPRGFVEMMVNDYIERVNKINELLDTEYADAPASDKKRIAERLQERILNQTRETITSRAGAMSSHVTGRDGVSARERAGRERANARAEARSGAIAAVDEQKQLKELLGRYSEEGKKAVRLYEAWAKEAPLIFRANEIKKDKSKTKEQKISEIVELLPNYNNIEQLAAGRGPVFDKDQIFFLLNKLRRVRNKAEEFGAFLPLPKGVYVMRGGRLGYDPKRAED